MDIIKTYEYFNSLIELIPPKFYFPEEVIKASKASKEEIKILKKAAKLEKLSGAHPSTLDIQKQKEQENAARDSAEKKESVSIQELREKLRSKIEEMEKKRDKPKSREELLNERKRKREEGKKNEKKVKKAAKTEKVEKLVVEKKKEEINPVEENEDDSLMFNKINEDRKHKKRKLDPYAALKKLESKKEAEITEETKEQINWSKTLKKAEGVKLQDDEKLLKKTIKKKEKIKKKSEKEWKDRNKQVKKQQGMKQKKREENLQKRKDENKKRKIEKRKKR